MGSRVNQRAPRGQARRYRLAFFTWLGLYPILTGTALAVEPLLAGQPVPVRTFVTSALLVPTRVYLVMPQLHRILEAKVHPNGRARVPPGAGSVLDESEPTHWSHAYDAFHFVPSQCPAAKTTTSTTEFSNTSGPDTRKNVCPDGTRSKTCSMTS